MSYYHLQSLTLTPPSPTPTSFDIALANFICPGCVLPRVGIGPLSVCIESKIENIPLSGVAGLGIGILRRDFLEALGTESVSNDLKVGQIISSYSNVIDDYVTFRGKRMAIVRGNQNSTHRICDKCGRVIYFPIGKRHLVKTPTDSFSIFESNFNQLIVNEVVYNRIKNIKWKKLWIDPLEVRSVSLDGLDLPADFPN